MVDTDAWSNNLSKFDRRIKNILIKYDLISQVKLETDYGPTQLDPNKSLQEHLLDAKEISEYDLIATISKEVNLPPIDVSKITVHDDVLNILPQDLANYYGVLPISKVGTILTVAIANPFDIVKIDDIAIVTGFRIRTVITSERSLIRGIQRCYNPGEEVMEEILASVLDPDIELKSQEEDDEFDLASLATSEDDTAPVIKLVNFIIYKGVTEKASDIHIEPFERHLRIRYRIDGKLSIGMTPPKGMHNAISSRLKIMADLDIAERRNPQDGKFQLRIEGKQIDFRVSSLPMVHGEKIVLRILDSSNLAANLDSLGFEPPALAAFRKSLDAPYGMILVTGPTGSGKSTTLYSCVNEVINDTENIVTVEDPVEYQLDGVNQVPVNPKRGLTFAAALRSILRQDPDTIMIGEIRDLETVEIAVKAALTGHRVFSTLHTNDSASTITRMIDMGVDPFMVASSVLLVAAQRLGRRICKHCREELELPEQELLKLGFKESDFTDDFILYKAKGCAKCSDGHKGRFAILEVLEMNDALRRIIIDGGSALDIKELALKQEMISLRRCGLLNAMRGITSLEDVISNTVSD